MNKSYFSKNMAILEKKIPSKLFSAVSTEEIKVYTAKSGVPTLSKRTPGSQDWIQFHSKYDPVKEAREQVARLDLEKANLCVVFGFGLGYAVEELLKLKADSPNLKILVIEPDISIVYTTISNRDISSLLSSPRVNFFIGKDYEEFYSFCTNFFQLSAIKNMGILEHPPSLRFHSSFFENVQEIIRSHIIQSAENLLTLMEEGGGYQVNTLTSIGEVIKRPGVAALFGQFEEIPTVIVSAGPSLDKNVHLLNMAKDNVLIIAVDTAVKPLLGYGIKPHLVVIADPSFENYTHISWCQKGDFYLVAEPMAYPSALKQFSDKLFIASFDDRMMEYLQKYIGKKGKLKAWGSVSSMAFDLGRKMGTSPIIFIGQDLAYSGGRNYCGNTEHDGLILSSGSAETRSNIEQKDIFGFPVIVEQQHYTYANYLSREFEENKSLVINATEGGILKNGVKIMSFKEALFRYARKKVSVEEKLDKIYQRSLAHPPSLGRLEANLKRVVRSMKRVERECKGGMHFVSSNKKKIMAKNNIKISTFDINCVLSEVQRVKDFVSREKDILPFLEMAGQKALFSFKCGFQNLEGREANVEFLDDALNLYGNLFANVNDVVSQILPSFEKACGKVSNQRISSK